MPRGTLATVPAGHRHTAGNDVFFSHQDRPDIPLGTGAPIKKRKNIAIAAHHPLKPIADVDRLQSIVKLIQKGSG